MSKNKLLRSIRSAIEDEGYRVNSTIVDTLQDLADLVIEENEQYDEEEMGYEDEDD